MKPKNTETYQKYTEMFKRKLLDTKNVYGIVYALDKYHMPMSTISRWTPKHEKNEPLEDQRIYNKRPHEDDFVVETKLPVS